MQHGDTNYNVLFTYYITAKLILLITLEFIKIRVLCKIYFKLAYIEFIADNVLRYFKIK